MRLVDVVGEWEWYGQLRVRGIDLPRVRLHAPAERRRASTVKAARGSGRNRNQQHRGGREARKVWWHYLLWNCFWYMNQKHSPRIVEQIELLLCECVVDNSKASLRGCVVREKKK